MPEAVTSLLDVDGAAAEIDARFYAPPVPPAALEDEAPPAPSFSDVGSRKSQARRPSG